VSAIVSNLHSMEAMGILANRNSRSQSLQFRRYNLIYGFNGSGKSTISRLFSSLEAGQLHPRLPEDGSFELSLHDGTRLGCPSNPIGLRHQLKVFNSDFVEANLQWAAGQANPVFFIGANQADAAAELARVDGKIEKSRTEITLAEQVQKLFHVQT
jgi:wobble nucleotide-excising tRNase